MTSGIIGPTVQSLLIAGAFFLYLSMIGIGVVSAFIHDRTSPQTVRDGIMWVCRGTAYVTIAGSVMLGVLWGVVVYTLPTVAGLIIAGVVGLAAVRRSD